MKKGLIFIIVFILYLLLDVGFYKSLNYFYNSDNPYNNYYKKMNKIKEKNIMKYLLIYFINTLLIFYLGILKNPFLHPMLRFIHNILLAVLIYSLHTSYLSYISNYPNNLIILDILFNAITYPLVSFISLYITN